MNENKNFFRKLPSSSLIKSKVQSNSHQKAINQANLVSVNKLNSVDECKPLIWSGSLFVRENKKSNSSRKVYNFQGGGFKGMIMRAKRVQSLLPSIKSLGVKSRNKNQSQSDLLLNQVYLPLLYRSVSYSTIPNQIKN
jgi:hypothetical protein